MVALLGSGTQVRAEMLSAESGWQNRVAARALCDGFLSIYEQPEVVPVFVEFEVAVPRSMQPE
jgi:hypothetical protein